MVEDLFIPFLHHSTHDPTKATWSLFRPNLLSNLDLCVEVLAVKINTQLVRKIFSTGENKFSTGENKFSTIENKFLASKNKSRLLKINSWLVRINSRLMKTSFRLVELLNSRLGVSEICLQSCIRQCTGRLSWQSKKNIFCFKSWRKVLQINKI